MPKNYTDEEEIMAQRAAGEVENKGGIFGLNEGDKRNILNAKSMLYANEIAKQFGVDKKAALALVDRIGLSQIEKLIGSPKSTDDMESGFASIKSKLSESDPDENEPDSDEEDIDVPTINEIGGMQKKKKKALDSLSGY